MKTLLVSAFLLIVLAQGLWALCAPASVIRFRRRMGWSESLLSGGFFYATEGRARVIGALLVLVSLSGLLIVASKFMA